MIFAAAAACAAAGISYIFDEDEPSAATECEAVTVSSTIVDTHGIIRYLSYPQWRDSHPLMQPQYNGIGLQIHDCRSNRRRTPIVRPQRIDQRTITPALSVVFFWSMPLKARGLQACTRKCTVVENLNPFERHRMTISVGTQNDEAKRAGTTAEGQSYRIQRISEGDSVDTLTQDTFPISILKKVKLNVMERNTNHKRFCADRLPATGETESMRLAILTNVNLCVENLSKILREACSDDDERSAKLDDASSIRSLLNKNDNACSESYQSSEPVEDLDSLEERSDGIILHRGRWLGASLGEPMIRKFHSIHELQRLLSKASCLLLQQHQIQSIEDLIRLFLERGQCHFTELLTTRFKVDPLVVEQLNSLLLRWTSRMT